VYDLYWTTLGGGEQVAGSLAQVLAASHDVTLLAPGRVDVQLVRERLGIDISMCGQRWVADDLDATAASGDYDLFVNVTYLSRAENRAPAGWYYVHFPQPPPTRRELWRHRISVAGVRALRVPPRLPQRLLDVQAGFDRRVVDTRFLETYQRFLANSRFTAGWVDRLWHVPADVLYPPVRPEVVALEKRPLILNIGRFFHPRFGHSKKQLELIETFKRSGITSWTLSLAGGCDTPNRDYALSARRAAVGHPIEVHVNATGETVRRLLGEASIYWHAGGFGEDEQRNPQRFEHFGITVVEAMAAGAVPIVFAAAGPAEIVEHGVNGFHWRTPDELIVLTRRLLADPAELRMLAGAARSRAQDFSAARFESEVLALAG
jgi:glycosyltransferase involved in cell wall biosynthesis